MSDLIFNKESAQFERKPAEALASKQRKRFFSAGESASFLGWDIPVVSQDAALYANLNKMKGRCRDLARNNDYIRHAVRLFESNIVGADGFRLQGKLRLAGKPKSEFNKDLERNWRNAGKLKNSPTVDSSMSRIDMAKLWVRTLMIDGEVIRVIHPAADNKYRFAIQFVDTARLDWQMNKQLPNGHQVRMGIEINELGKPIAYYFLQNDPSDHMWGYVATSKTHTRITADRVRHDFIKEMPGQTRGVPMIASPAVRAHMLQRFEEAVVVGARVAASKVGFYKTDEDAPGYAPGDGEDDEGVVSHSIDPGTFEQLPRGVSLETFDPSYPPVEVESFMKKMLKGMASSIGVDYVSMANDLEGVNYSSIRAGQLEQREIYRGLQNFYVEHCEERDFNDWAKVQLFNADVDLDRVDLTRTIEEESYKFIGRGWKWVDPLKDVKAYGEAIRLRLTSRRRIVAETLGEDYDDLLDEIDEDEKSLIERGLNSISESTITEEDLEDEDETPSGSPPKK